MENPTPMSESQYQRRSVPRTVTPLSVPAIDSAGALRFPLKQQALDALVREAAEAADPPEAVGALVTRLANALATSD